MTNEGDKLTFEQAIDKLEGILKKLENEDTPLDQMVELYEKANKLAASPQEEKQQLPKKKVLLSHISPS